MGGRIGGGWGVGLAARCDASRGVAAKRARALLPLQPASANPPPRPPRTHAQKEEAAREAEALERGEKAPPRPSRQEVRRSIGKPAGRPVKYWVTDREPTDKKDWGRVVAVFCLGKAWQFKKWPFKVGARVRACVRACVRGESRGRRTLPRGGRAGVGASSPSPPSR